jgi:hypothetical protein
VQTHTEVLLGLVVVVRAEGGGAETYLRGELSSSTTLLRLLLVAVSCTLAQPCPALAMARATNSPTPRGRSGSGVWRSTKASFWWTMGSKVWGAAAL